MERIEIKHRSIHVGDSIEIWFNPPAEELREGEREVKTWPTRDKAIELAHVINASDKMIAALTQACKAAEEWFENTDRRMDEEWYYDAKAALDAAGGR